MSETERKVSIEREARGEVLRVLHQYIRRWEIHHSFRNNHVFFGEGGKHKLQAAGGGRPTDVFRRQLTLFPSQRKGWIRGKGGSSGEPHVCHIL